MTRKSNRYHEICDTIDHQTNGYKFRKESMMHKTDAPIRLISAALAFSGARNIFGSLLVTTKTGIATLSADITSVLKSKVTE